MNSMIYEINDIGDVVTFTKWGITIENTANYNSFLFDWEDFNKLLLILKKIDVIRKIGERNG